MSFVTRKEYFYDNGKVSTLPLDYVFAYPIADYDLHQQSRPTLINAPTKTLSLPMTNRYHGVDVSYFDPTMQKWLCEINSYACGGLSDFEKKKYMDAVFADGVAFTDHQPNLDYGTNMTINLANIMTFAVFRVLDSDSRFTKFEVIDTSKNYLEFTPWSHPWLFFKALSSHRVQVKDANGKWTGEYYGDGRNPFWQFKENCYIPLHGRPLPGKQGGVAYIESEKVRILKPGESWPALHVPATKLEI